MDFRNPDYFINENRTLKRPMFRMGGSTGTGITSGLDRQNYQEGGGSKFFHMDNY